MRSKSLALALILLTILGTGSWHVEGDDPDFLPEVVGHDHSRHHEAFRTPETSTSDGSGHCAICHWLQIFRAGPVHDARIDLPAPRSGPGGVATTTTLHPAALFDVPSRAPPA